MLQELLKELKQALNDHDEKAAKAIIKTLNRAGMDNYTIKILLQDI